MTVVIEPVGPGDRDALAALFAACSDATVRQRFFGRPGRFPPAYLDALVAGRPHAHDAVGAWLAGGRLVGLASLGASGDAGPPELGVLVADGFQGRGIGADMVWTILDRARDRGVPSVLARVLPGRSSLLGALARRLPVDHASWTADGVAGVFRLDKE
jgi:GNAT superfamily N-acetyltransferase